MKLINTAWGILGSRFLGRPFYARFHITLRCNYHCQMCGMKNRSSQSKELGLEEIHTVAQHLADIGVRHLVITGGEPFLRPDLPNVVAAFAAHKFSVRIQTNGGAHVTRELLTKCVEAGLHDLSVSLDSLDQSLQDSICQAPNVVENALMTLTLASELLPKSITLANVVASKLNFAEIPALVRFFHERGVFTYITPVMISDASQDCVDDYLFRSSDSGFSLTDLDSEVRDRVIDELVVLRRRGLGLTNSTRFLEDWRQHMASGHCERICDAGKLSLDVLPDGSVCACKEKQPIDNILDPDFVLRYRKGQFHEQAAEMIRSCCGCSYGEYREPYYAVHDLSTFVEWVRDWFLFYRKGIVKHRGRDDGNSRLE
jgi:MoaA/NifB/PqqE/SkfB family radical SAM enzyme